MSKKTNFRTTTKEARERFATLSIIDSEISALKAEKRDALQKFDDDFISYEDDDIVAKTEITSEVYTKLTKKQARALVSKVYTAPIKEHEQQFENVAHHLFDVSFKDYTSALNIDTDSNLSGMVKRAWNTIGIQFPTATQERKTLDMTIHFIGAKIAASGNMLNEEKALVKSLNKKRFYSELVYAIIWILFINKAVTRTAEGIRFEGVDKETMEGKND